LPHGHEQIIVENYCEKYKYFSSNWEVYLLEMIEKIKVFSLFWDECLLDMSQKIKSIFPVLECVPPKYEPKKKPISFTLLGPVPPRF